MNLGGLFKLKDRLSLIVGKIMHDELAIRSNVLIELFDHNGNVKDVRKIHNTVTTAGKNDSADQLLDVPTTIKPGWMEVGTGTPTATLLGAFIAGSRTALSSKTRAANNIVTMVCTFGAGVGTGAITEAGVFNVVTPNTVDMYVSASFLVVNKLALDSLQITWTLTFG